MQRQSRFRHAVLALGGTSCMALIWAGSALAQETVDPANRAEDTAAIVVTGTRIEGVAQVGSAVIAVSQADALKSGAGSTADFLRQIPQVMSFGGSEGKSGGAGVQGADVNTGFVNSVNLRGLGTAATLNLVNNRRVPAMGQNSDLFDPDAIPSLALQGIEIIPDGASAIYGSDAVTGVVNYITRKPFNGVEVSGRFGYAKGRTDWKAGAVASRNWGSGGILVAYEHVYRKALRASSRRKLYNDDFSSYGGAPLSTFSQPGNVVGADGTIYGIPGGHATNLTLADLSPTANRESRWTGLDALPEIESNAVTIRAEQEVLPGLELYVDGLYYRRSFAIAVGSYATTLSVPASNPYSPCNPAHGSTTNPYGLSCASNLQVIYDFKNDFGPEVRAGHESIINGTVGARFDLPASWKGDVYASFGRSKNHVKNADSSIVVSRLNELLAGPSGTLTAFNPFCDTAGCNDPASVNYLRAYSTNNYSFDRTDISGSLSGPLFALPGGLVRAAIGGEHITDKFVNFNENTNNGIVAIQRAASPVRKINAVFGEIHVPLFGSDNARPGLEVLELSAAVRYEHYSDFGGTTNPRFGVSWVPVSGLKLHGSYGTSFRAPVLSSNNPYAQAGLLTNATVLSLDLAGTGFTGANPTYQPTWIIGGNGQLKPETAKTWSIGADWQPDSLPGLALSLNYYNVRYSNKIDYPAYNAGATAALLSDYFAPYVYRNPRFFTDGATMSTAEWDALLNALLSGNAQPAGSAFDTVPRVVLGPAPSSANTIALIDARRNNTGIVTTDGLDFSAYYRWTDNWASWTIGGAGSWVFNYKNAVAPGAPVEQQVNMFASPLRFSARGEISATIGAVTPSLFVNYANSYKIARRYIPAGAADKYLNVDSHTTVDLTLTYRIDENSADSALRNLVMVLGVQNLFDTMPPLVLNSSGTGIMYDNNQGSPLGRVISLQVRKAF